MVENKAEILKDDKKTLLRDTLENLVAQLGNENDKRSYSKFVNTKRLSQPGAEPELEALYRTDWLAGKVVDILPDDMTREWRSFNGEMDPEIVKQLVEEEKRLQLRSKVNEAHKWSRLYGTSFLIMSIDDGGQPWEPLNFDTIKKDGFKHLQPIDRTRMSSYEIKPVTNPLDANFGLPEFYRFSETSIRIHHSRVVRFDAVKLPYNEFRRQNYFSDSVLDRLYDSILNFNTGASGSASMIYETNVDIMKVKGLMSYLQTPEQEEILRKRFALAGLLKSFNNMMLLDSEEDFETKTNAFSGLEGLIDKFLQILSAACDIPATRLLGRAPSGLNATGEGDLKNYYDKCSSLQETEYRPKLDVIDKIIVKSAGLRIENDDLTYKFNPLFQMTQKEQAELEKQKAERDRIYFDMGAIDEIVVAKELQQNGTYTNLTEEYIKELEGLKEEAENAFITNPVNFENTEQQGNEEEEGKNGGGSEESEIS